MKKYTLFILLCLVFASGCMSQNTVEQGDHIAVDYIGRFENGSVFDTSLEQVAVDSGLYSPSRNYGPLSFVAGQGQMIEGFDEAVIGMYVGEEKTVTIPPEKAYGNYSRELLLQVPSEDFDNANITPVIGEQVNYMWRTCTIVDVADGNVTLDCNHQLAGETLVFTIQIVSIGE
ncbi:MAG: peptidylprolyl isomerase [Methanolobus sp.]|uniref:FKBP-type peptidyl-prolyl cis-trans isomerase n=1 Tax=Methanolobus sp. TaxID=1874737 RepID=UPI0027318F3D|nr:peptidylprolyl isomerase [Methanolobus sp.]MDP2216878.1 peptidylprolyl isomerase [Methanolobus sp.]